MRTISNGSLWVDREKNSTLSPIVRRLLARERGPSALVQGVDGNLYGTANSGGANNVGTILKLRPAKSEP
jgi:uncharacterized repeat protein (TIGR03803 family)